MFKKICPQCGGHGVIEARIMVNIGPLPFYRSEIVICTNCNGTGQVCILRWW